MPDDSGADVIFDFRNTKSKKFCTADAFVTRKSYWADFEYSKKVEERIFSIPIKKTSEIDDINDPSKHNWYSICRRGNDAKYGWLMYDPISDTLRDQTVGEFYETSTVD